MNKSDIEPAGGGAAIWPLTVQQGRDLALPGQWSAQSYGGNKSVEFNLATLWRVLLEWRWLILGTLAVALALAVIVTLLTTPLYKSTAVLEINPPSVEILEDSKARSSGGNDREFLATQYGLLASRSLAERVGQDLNIAADAELVPQDLDRATRQKVATGILQGGFDVDPVPNSRLVNISFDSPSPQMAARVANSFADNFINANLERRYEASSYARSFLERQIARVKAELERSERQLVAYAQAQGIINIGTGEGPSTDASSLQGASLTALNEALAAAQGRRIAAEQRWRQGSGAMAAEVTEGTAPLRAQRAGLEAEYQEKLSQFKADYPEMVRLRSKIDSLERAIRAETGIVSGGRSSTLRAEYLAAAAEERSLEGRVAGLKGSVLNLRGRSVQYNILQRELETQRTLYDALLGRYKEIGVAGGIGTNLVSVVDRAQVPGGPFKPNLPFNLMIGLLLGLVTGIGAALALEFINDTIKTPDDVRDKLQLASLGIIPKKKGAEPLSEDLKDQASPVSEAYFSLRTSLQFTTEHGAPKSLLITSTRASEGKSSTTLALAQNFARLGNKVLLIDSDLRKPAFVTGLEQSEGLSRLLTAQEPLEGHVLRTQFENLSLLPCGPLPPNPAELLASPRLRAIIKAAGESYDMVIVDGPPVLGLADAPLLSAVCEGTLLIIESGRTRTKAALDTINRLRASGGHILGAVLTKFRAQSHGYGYGYGYGYEPYKYGGIGSREREIRLIAQRDDS